MERYRVVGLAILALAFILESIAQWQSQGQIWWATVAAIATAGVAVIVAVVGERRARKKSARDRPK